MSTAIPPPADDSPVARLAHTLAIYDEVPRLRPRDDEWAVTATHNIYGYGVRTGLTWGDLRALHADLTACSMCLRADCPDDCGRALDQPEETP